MRKKLRLISGLKPELSNAPREIKQSYNELIKFFSVTNFEDFLCEFNLLSKAEMTELTGLYLSPIQLVEDDQGETFESQFIKIHGMELYENLKNWYDDHNDTAWEYIDSKTAPPIKIDYAARISAIEERLGNYSTDEDESEFLDSNK